MSTTTTTTTTTTLAREVATRIGAALKRASDASDTLTETLLVEHARDVLASDRRRRREAREAATEAKREQARALNDAIRAGDVAAAAEAAQIAASDAAEQASDNRAAAAEKFGRAVDSAFKSGLPVALMFELIATRAGIESPVIAVPVAA